MRIKMSEFDNELIHYIGPLKWSFCARSGVDYFYEFNKPGEEPKWTCPRNARLMGIASYDCDRLVKVLFLVYKNKNGIVVRYVEERVTEKAMVDFAGLPLGEEL